MAADIDSAESTTQSYLAREIVQGSDSLRFINPAARRDRRQLGPLRHLAHQTSRPAAPDRENPIRHSLPNAQQFFSAPLTDYASCPLKNGVHAGEIHKCCIRMQEFLQKRWDLAIRDRILAPEN